MRLMIDHHHEAQIAIALDQGDYQTAERLAATHTDPTGCSQWIETYQHERRREQYIRRIRQLWREERDLVGHTPPSDLATTLHHLSLAELETLGKAIRARVDAAAAAARPCPSATVAQPTTTTTEVAEPPPLPDGWRWIGRYQAYHPTYGRTSTYHDLRACLKEVRRKTPTAQRPPLAPRQAVQGELFAEVQG